MEKVILKSMTDFVLEQRMSTEKVNESSFYQIQSHIYSYYDKIFASANFLKQPLNLGMFVPAKLVDGVWVVLEKPTETHEVVFNDSEYLKEYQEVKERVLFEGFEAFRSVNALVSFSKVKNGLGRLDWNKEGNFMMGYTKESTIEDLYNSHYTDLELTPTAQKQIGL